MQRSSETNSSTSKTLTSALEAMYLLSSKDKAALSYTSEKTLRIASAVLCLVDILDTESTLRNELERTAIGLVTDATTSMHSQAGRDSLLQRLLALSALLSTGLLAGKLSSMNVDLLQNELSDLALLFRRINWQTGHRFIEVSSQTVEVPHELKTEDTAYNSASAADRHVKDRYESGVGVERPFAAVNVAPNIKDTEQATSKVQYSQRVQQIQKDRRATILGLLQRKDRITVRDAAIVIKDCSEKTIQRELLALVAQGVLKKEGERRWSTYCLA